MKLFGDIYRNKRVLVTGHTGFKGSWLVLWLTQLGAEVTGVSLPSGTGVSHWSLLRLFAGDFRHDIRDFAALSSVFKQVQPEIVFHLAAQPLVRQSYLAPLETWSTNVMGTAHLLEACRRTASVRSVLVVTTDKCYQNREWPWGYRETDRLGGHDPYSASKAAVELMAASYRNAFFSSESYPLLATARAGNVIGGGDWSLDRLIPDAIRALGSNHPLFIRSPSAVRPWQHVLESLSGYLLLGKKLYEGDRKFSDAWNFGPGADGNRTVADVLDTLGRHWKNIRWKVDDQPLAHESNLLQIDSSKARDQLGWKNVWNLDTALEKTADWYRIFQENQEIISRQQLDEFTEAAAKSSIQWTKYEC